MCIRDSYASVTAEEIVILGAPEEGIYLTMRTLLEPGDHVVALTPAYDSLVNLAEHVSGNVTPWPVRPTPGGWEVDPAELARLLRPDTRLIIVNFPHNPTGYLPSAETLAALLDIARGHGAWLLCDEMYRGLEHNPADRLASAADGYERAIVLSGLSKTHGLPGLRVGWLIVRDAATRAALINWKHYTTICPPAPSDRLALAALQAHAPLVERSRGIIATNLQLAEAFFARHAAQFVWRAPRAGCVVYKSPPPQGNHPSPPPRFWTFTAGLTPSGSSPFTTAWPGWPTTLPSGWSQWKSCSRNWASPCPMR